MENMDAYVFGNEIRICVSNIKELDELLEKAYQEAEQLRKTIHKLSVFNLNFKFDFNSESEPTQ